MLGVAAALALAACGGQAARPAAGPTPAPPTPGAPGAPRITGQACSALTAADVRSALGVQVDQLPMTSPPPGGGPGGTLFSGCSYAASGGTPAGVSLFLFRDMPIDYLDTVPGYQKVPGIGDRAYVQVPMLMGQKAHVSFQLIVTSDADDAAKDRGLRAMGRTIAGRL
jgi:hypothetical protein